MQGASRATLEKDPSRSLYIGWPPGKGPEGGRGARGRGGAADHVNTRERPDGTNGPESDVALYHFW